MFKINFAQIFVCFVLVYLFLISFVIFASGFSRVAGSLEQLVGWGVVVMASSKLTTSVLASSEDKTYEISSEIGRGAYGTVYKARDRRDESKFVALKEITIPLHSEDGVPASTIREIGLLKQLEKYNHPNVVKYEC